LISIEEILEKLIEIRKIKKMSDFNEAMLLQQRFMSLQAIINVTDKEHDVERWYDQFVTWIRMQKITNSTDIYDWCRMKVQGQGSKNIQALVTKDASGRLVYPTLEQMRDALLKTYKLEKDPDDIINEIKSMKINKQEDVKEFNQKYLKLYNDLNDEYKLRITSYDYLDAIISKPAVWRSVKSEIKNKKITLSEAMEAVEFYDKMENELKLKTQNNNKNSNYNRSSNYNNQSGYNNNNNNHNNSNFNNKHKVSFCKFCHEKGHSISDCSGYAKFQYFKYMDSKMNNDFNNFNPNLNNFNNFPSNNFNNSNNNGTEIIIEIIVTRTVINIINLMALLI